MESIQLGNWVSVSHVDKDVSNKSWQRIWNEFPRMTNLKLLQRFKIRDLSRAMWPIVSLLVLITLAWEEVTYLQATVTCFFSFSE